MSAQSRPKFLNLLKIRLPITGIVSILHRVSGVIMILAIPSSIFFFDQSLKNAEGFRFAQSAMDNPIVLFVVLVVVWALSHHLFAGIRFLLFDLDVAVSKARARLAATLVMIFSLAFLAWVISEWLL